MKKVLMISTLVYITLSPSFGQTKVKILVITGGHEFDHRAFYSMFDAMSDIEYDTLSQPAANARIASKAVDQYSVLVFYDMYDRIKPSEQQAYIDLLNRGRGMIFLHHSLVSYQDWPEFTRIIGGHYYQEAKLVNGDTLKGNYQHDVSLPVHVVDATHPITRGLKDFTILDERYGGCVVLPTVKPLLTTSDLKSMKPLVWTNSYGNSEVVYIQLGHGPSAYNDANFRMVIRRAILWSALWHTPAKLR